MNNILRHFIRFVLVILLQWLLINNLHWLGIFHAYIYILPLLMLPATTPRWAEMLIGAAVGLIMDVVCSTAGVQMAATVAGAYFRPLLIGRLVQESQRISTRICSATMGNWQFITLLVLMVVFHHTLALLLEAWSVTHLEWLIPTILLSSFATICIGFLYDKTQR